MQWVILNFLFSLFYSPNQKVPALFFAHALKNWRRWNLTGATTLRRSSSPRISPGSIVAIRGPLSSRPDRRNQVPPRLSRRTSTASTQVCTCTYTLIHYRSTSQEMEVLLASICQAFCLPTSHIFLHSWFVSGNKIALKIFYHNFLFLSCWKTMVKSRY